jgi:hypothetical protein
MDRSKRLILAGLLAFVTAAVVAVGALGQAPAVGGYQLVSDVRVTRTVSELTYRAVLINGGEGLSSATATAISLSPATVIVDGTLTFGAVAPSGSVLSTDTFSFRQDRTVPFNWSNIRWSISSQLANHPPTADAGPDQTANVGATVTLDGSRSSDLDGDRLTYHWSLQSRPGDSGATLGSLDSVNPTLPIDRPGSYVIRLIVNDGVVDGAPATVTISTVNSAPVANAGADQTVLVGQPVALSGAGSSDVDGDTLTFAWTIVSRPVGSVAGVTNPASIAPVVTPDRPGTYQVQLVVNDGHTNSLPDIAVLTTGNSAPVANAGPDQSSGVGATVTLDGNASTDVDGDTLTYQWSLLSVPPGSTASLVNPTTVMPTLAVDRPGTYIAQLIVRDGSAASAPDTVAITTQNSRPLANAGPDQSIVAGQLVLLDGTGSSDPDGDTLAYDWSFVSRPLGSSANLAGATSAGPSFVADKGGTYVVQLLVSDATLSSAPDTVTLTTTNLPPVANAGPDQLNAHTGSTITLDGSSSTDPDGPILLYQWSLLSKPAGSAAVLNGLSTASPTFVADATGEYVAQLTVNDGFVNSAPDTVTIRASAPPVEFTFGLTSGTATGFAGSSTLIRFSVTNQSGISNPINVDMASPPDGISSAAVQLPPGISNGALTVDIDETVAVGDVLLVVSAAVGGVVHSASLTLTIRGAEPRAQEKIRAAMVAGTIDRSTSLLYRAYALVGDDRLPAEFLGSGSEDEDGSLFSEISEFLPTASPDARAQLEPFTLRPANPNSWYSHVIAPSSGASVQSFAMQAVVAAATADSLPSSCFTDTSASNGWISKRSPTYPFRVWAHCALGADANETAQIYVAAEKVVNFVADEIFERIWPQMTANGNGGMGQPTLDAPVGGVVNPADGVGDEAIDIYMTFPGDVVQRLSESHVSVKHAFGWASLWGVSSGYITMPIQYADEFALTAIHELFHVLQFKHNATLAAGGFALPGFGGLNNPPTRNWWYAEASATWAEAHFDRTVPGLPGGRQANPHVYQRWFKPSNRTAGFQKRDALTSLNSPGREPYEAFIWPYFMELRDGAAKPAQVWSSVAGVNDPASADGAMDGIFAFKDQFREFAKRDLNKALTPGNPLPRDDRFVHLDDFAVGFAPVDGVLPVVTRSITLAAPTLSAISIGVAPLATQYSKVDVTSAQIRKIVFDLQALQAIREGMGLDVDAYVKIKNQGWEYRDLNDKSELKFCQDDPAQELESLWLIVSNHTLQGQTGQATIPITAGAAPCEAKWVGTSIFDTQYKVFPNTHIRTTANVTWTRDDTSPLGVFGFDVFKPSGSAAVDLFEANGCVAGVAPRTISIGPTDGELTIDYNPTPNVAGGNGGVGWLPTITDCQGRQQPIPVSALFMADGPLELNDKGDQLVQHIILVDDATTLVTLDLNYTKVRQ